MSGVETFTQTKSFLGFLSPTPVEVSCAHLPRPTSAGPHTRRGLTLGKRTHTGHGTCIQSHTGQAHETHTQCTQACISSSHVFAALSHVSLAPWAAVFACSLLLSTIVRSLEDCLGSRHKHADIQTNAELTGGLLGDRPSTSSRCRHDRIPITSHPRDDGHALLTRACTSVASMAHAMSWGDSPIHARPLAMREL